MARPAAEMVIAIKGNTRDFTNKINQIIRSVDQISRRLRQMAAVARQVFVAASGAGFFAVRVFATYERQMTRVGQVTKATERQFGALKETARGLGATTEFTARQAAEGMYYLGLAGLEVNEILDATAGVLDLALVGEISLADAARVTARVLNVYGFEASKAADIADMLAKNVSSANITMREQTEALEFALSAAKLAKVPLEDVLAIIAKLGDAGVASSRGGTAIRRFINQIQKSAKELKQFGIEVYDSGGQINSVLSILRQFENRLEGLTDEQKRRITQTFGEIRAQEALNLLLSAGTDGLEAHAEELRNSKGFAKEYAEALRGDVVGQLIQLKSRLEEIAISFSSLLLPQIHKTIKGLKELQDRIIRLDDKKKKLIGNTIVMTARFAGFVALTAFVVRGFVNIGSAVVILSIALRRGAFAARGFWVAMGLGLTLVIPALIEGYLYLQRTNSSALVHMEYGWKGFWGFMDKAVNTFLLHYTKLDLFMAKNSKAAAELRGGDTSTLNARIYAGEQALHGYTTALLEARNAAHDLPAAYAAALDKAEKLRLATEAIGAEAQAASIALKEKLEGPQAAKADRPRHNAPYEKGQAPGTADSKRPGWLRGVGWGEFGETDRAERELENLKIHEERKKEIILEQAREQERQQEEIRRVRHLRETRWERSLVALKRDGFKSQNALARAGNKVLQGLRVADAIANLKTAISVDAPLAYSKTAARYPYPQGQILGAIAAAAVVAAAADGLASVKKFEYGGVVPQSRVVGGHGVRDTQLIRARAGELVADPTLTGNLSQMADSFLGPGGGGSGGGGMLQPIILEMDSEKVGEALVRVGQDR